MIALQSLDSKRQNLVIQTSSLQVLNQASSIRIDKAGFAQLGEGVISLLYQAQMVKANLKESDLSDAVLIRAKLASADLSRANLSSAVLTNANLSRANLESAILIRVNLSSANFSSADLHNAIFFGVDLSQTKNLTQQQLEGENPPLLCNVKLPKRINFDPNRHCKKLPQLLLERYPKRFQTLKAAQDYVNKFSKP